tara:strand:- start:1815 stop:2351 length:537 start_codon:yes stop_codon:yes gene_type:complete
LYLEAARAGVVDAYAGAGVVAMMRGDLREAMAAFRAGAVQGGGDATERLRALAMRRRDGRAAMATERGGADLVVTMRSEPDTSRAPSMQASDDLPDDTDGAGWVNDGGSRRDAHAGGRGWTAGWDADHHAERYESEIARYYRLSRDLYDAMVGSGDPAMARAAEEAVHEAFPEMRAHH